MDAKKLSQTRLFRAGFVLCGSVAIGLAFWEPLEHQEHSHVRQITSILARNVRTDLSDELRSQTEAQVRLAKLLSVDEKLSQRDWESQAKLFLIDYPGYLSVQWVDAEYHLRWSAAEAEGEPQQTALLAADAPLGRVLRDVVKRGERGAVFTPRFPLQNARSGRGIVVPAYSLENFRGSVIAVFDEWKNFEDILSDHAGLGYSVDILEGTQSVFEMDGSGPRNKEKRAQEADLDLPGATWKIRVWPKPQLLREISTALPQVALTLGSLIGLLLFLALDFARTVRRTGRAVRHSQGRLLEMINSAMDAIISVDENQRVVVFNQAAEAIFRCTSSEAIGQPVSQFIPERFRDVHLQHIENFGRTGISSRSMISPGMLWGLRADGEEFPMEASISQTKAATDKLYTVILRDVTVRNRAEQELRQARDELESRVLQRTAELQSANTKLEAEIQERRQAEESLRDLSGRLLRLRDEEQRRLARELHDSTAQIMGALAVELERVRPLVATTNIPKAQELLAKSSELAEKATAEVRTLSYLLHPPILDDLGLEVALPWYVDGFTKRSGIQVRMDVESGLGRLPQELELTLFRLVQEALTNIHRHSGSPTAEIVVSRDATGVTLQITDRGHGMRTEILESARRGRAMVGVGIAGMGERARQLNGRLEIESGDNGTSIKVILPIDAEALAAQG